MGCIRGRGVVIVRGVRGCSRDRVIGIRGGGRMERLVGRWGLRALGDGL